MNEGIAHTFTGGTLTHAVAGEDKDMESIDFIISTPFYNGRRRLVSDQRQPDNGCLLNDGCWALMQAVFGLMPLVGDQTAALTDGSINLQMNGGTPTAAKNTLTLYGILN